VSAAGVDIFDDAFETKPGTKPQNGAAMQAKPLAPQHRAGRSEAKPARSVHGVQYYLIGANALIVVMMYYAGSGTAEAQRPP
jgi:hypothetical protein